MHARQFANAFDAEFRPLEFREQILADEQVGDERLSRLCGEAFRVLRPRRARQLRAELGAGTEDNPIVGGNQQDIALAVERCLLGAVIEQAIFAAVLIAASVRIAAGVLPTWYEELLYAGATAWVIAFIGFTVVYGPMLTNRRLTSQNAA